ncbi:MAG: fatty acid desaturase [Myxococcales bacterium]|nr:fatty acid desaturase [Myxococcales bacterium]
MRSGRDLIEATKSFTPESRVRSWWYVLSTTLVMIALYALAWQPIVWPVRLAIAVLAGFVTVREFILYHDYMHGALLRGSKLARFVLYPVGVFVMTPPRVWKETHNYHHAHTAQLVGSNIGSFATMTLGQWAEATPAQRRHYRIVRHPLTVLFAYFTAFMLDMCLMSFLRSPRKRWDSLLALLVNWALTAVIVWKFGAATFFFGFFLPLAVAMASGAYLFYAQHNFEGLYIQRREEWAYDYAALRSSSYMPTGPVLGWLTGNIGYHHVHHLNPTIPFYRLPEAMAAIPELQNPPATRLTPAEIAANFRLKLWDPEQKKMVGFPQ